MTATETQGGSPMMWWIGDWGWGAWLAMMLAMVSFWVLVVWVVVHLVRAIGAEPRHDPEEVLAERFARGEIDDEEFHHRSEVLRSPR